MVDVVCETVSECYRSTKGNSTSNNTTPAIIPSTLLPPSPPATPPPPARTSSCSRANDSCFNCKRLGHWYEDCPNKTPKKSQRSSPGSNSYSPSSINIFDLPLIRCPCGLGICPVKVSSTLKNSGKCFYGCPGAKLPFQGCGFFKWCNDAPSKECPCGAGMCSLNKETSGPNAGRWYFACRIKKNHGACQFIEWVDSHVKATINKPADANMGCFSPQCLYNNQQVSNAISNNSEKEEGLSFDMEFDSPAVESSENPQNLSISDVDEVIDNSLGMQLAESMDPMIGRGVQISHIMSQPEISYLEAEFCRISAVGDTLLESINFLCAFSLSDVIYQIVHHFHGWLGRLAFPPPYCLKDPHTNPFFCCNVNMSYFQGSTLLPPSPSNLEAVISLPTAANDVQPVSALCLELSEFKNPTYMVAKNDMSTSIFKTFGQGLLNILQSMNYSDHEKMLKLAEDIFDFLRDLSVDCGPFSECVKEYIQCASILDRTEGSMHTDIFLEELVNIYTCEKVEFDNVCRSHAEAVARYEASNNHLESLRHRASQVQDMLFQLEKQLSFHESGTLELQTHVSNLSRAMLETEKRLDAAYQDMEKSLNLDAANAALESAVLHLQ